jgi:hypothetical protein
MVVAPKIVVLKAERRQAGDSGIVVGKRVRHRWMKRRPSNLVRDPTARQDPAARRDLMVLPDRRRAQWNFSASSTPTMIIS